MTKPTHLTQAEIYDICWDHAQTFPEVADAIYAHIQDHFPNDFQDAAQFIKAFADTVADTVDFETDEQVIESLNNMVYLGL